MTVEMPEPGFPLSWKVLLVNIKIKRSVANSEIVRNHTGFQSVPG